MRTSQMTIPKTIYRTNRVAMVVLLALWALLSDGHFSALCAQTTIEKPADAEPNVEEPAISAEKREVIVSKAPKFSEDIPPPPIMRDLSKLPFPVRRMRELILEAAVSGEI